MKFKRVAEHLFLAENGYYYAIVKVRGQKLRESLNTTDRQLANNRKADAVKRLQGYRPGTAITFAQLITEWRTRRLATMDVKPSMRYYREQNLNVFQRYCPGWFPMKIRQLTPAHMETFEAKRAPHVSAQRWNNELGTLRLLFRFALEQGWLMHDPSAQLARRKIPKRQPRIPTRAEFCAIIADLVHRQNQRAAWFLEVLAYSGLRRNEVAHLEWSDIDTVRKVVRVTGGEGGTKNRDERFIPLFPALANTLARIPRTVGQRRIFSIAQCRDSLADSCRRLKFDTRFTHHHFRHFFCSNAIESGVDFKTIAAWLGHKDGGILAAQTYGHLRPEHSARMAELITFTAGGQNGGQTATVSKRRRAAG